MRWQKGANATSVSTGIARRSSRKWWKRCRDCSRHEACIPWRLENL